MKFASLALAASLGLAVGLVFTGQVLPGSAQGQDGDSGNEGVRRAARIDDVYKMSTKINREGRRKDPEKVSDDRTWFHAPEHLGTPIAVTGHGPDAVIWFREGSTISNVVVRRAAERLVTVDQVPSENKELRVR